MNPLLPHIYFANYHTHTARCHHASGTEEEYILRAIELGYDCLGFSDHTPWPYENGFVSPIRMLPEELEGYVCLLRNLREKYEDRIRILIGLECEAFPAYFDWIAHVKKEYAPDYVLLGNHYDTDESMGGMYFGRSCAAEHLAQYARATIRGMESGLFAYLAHPDLALYRYGAFDSAAQDMCRAICETAQRLDMPIEYNILGHNRQEKSRRLGYIGYCSPEFWKIASEYKCRAIIGADAHAPEELNCVSAIADARQKLSEMGISVMSGGENGPF